MLDNQPPEGEACCLFRDLEWSAYLLPETSSAYSVGQTSLDITTRSREDLRIKYSESF